MVKNSSLFLPAGNRLMLMPAHDENHVLTSLIPLRQPMEPEVAWPQWYSGLSQKCGHSGGMSIVAQGPGTGACADFWCVGWWSRASTLATSPSLKSGPDCPVTTRACLFGGLEGMSSSSRNSLRQLLARSRRAHISPLFRHNFEASARARGARAASAFRI